MPKGSSVDRGRCRIVQVRISPLLVGMAWTEGRGVVLFVVGRNTAVT